MAIAPKFNKFNLQSIGNPNINNAINIPHFLFPVIQPPAITIPKINAKITNISKIKVGE